MKISKVALRIYNVLRVLFASQYFIYIRFWISFLKLLLWGAPKCLVPSLTRVCFMLFTLSILILKQISREDSCLGLLN